MLNKKGQNTAEYAILIALVVAAAVGIQTYVKQSLQGKIKDGLDHVGPALTLGKDTLTFTAARFEPAAINSSIITESERTYDEGITARGNNARTNIVEQSKITKGSYEQYR